MALNKLQKEVDFQFRLKKPDNYGMHNLFRALMADLDDLVNGLEKAFLRLLERI